MFKKTQIMYLGLKLIFSYRVLQGEWEECNDFLYITTHIHNFTVYGIKHMAIIMALNIRKKW